LVDVGPAQALWVTLAVRVPFDVAQGLGPGAHPLYFEVQPQARASSQTVRERSTFIVPR
jgi:hypothetical protein